MGKFLSKPDPSPPATLTKIPWRKTNDWEKSVRDELKEHVASLAPITSDDIKVPFFNILLTGQIGSGKSSFYNGTNSLFRGRIIPRADTGEAGQSLTNEYRVYEIKSHPSSPPMAWRICDTMGLKDNTTESDIRNLLKAVDGHVPNKCTFTPGKDFTDEARGYISNPTLAEKAHCVAVVINASREDVIKEDMWRKFRSLREGLISRNIPTFIILSHIDKACVEVAADVSKVYRSIKVRDIVSKVSKQLMGLPENQIFPVKNYSEDIDLDVNMDILLLYAMRQMLYACQGHIENKM